MSPSDSRIVWVGYQVAPLDSIPKTHPTEIKAFATEKAAREWASELNLREGGLPYGMGRHVLSREVHG